MRRIYSEIKPVPGEGFDITGGDADHLSRSLRAKRGEHIVICSGGRDYDCVITEITRDRVTVIPGEGVPLNCEPKVGVTLYIGYPKGDKLESVIQKSTELGVRAIVPFLADRSVARPSEAAAAERQKRWQKIAEEAAKQSGRGEVPKVFPLQSYGEAVKRGSEKGLRLFCFEGGGCPLSEALKTAAGADIAVFTGPEGGFSEREVDAALSLGYQLVTLGKRILRCETAPICVISAIMYYGEF